MTIDQAGLDELKRLYLKHHNLQLTDGEALEFGSKLVDLFKVISKPIPVLDTNRKEVENENNA